MKSRPIAILFMIAMLAVTSCKSHRDAVKSVPVSGPSSGRQIGHMPGTTPDRTPAGARPEHPDAILVARIEAEARSWLGVPYSYGGASRSGTDCSGLVMNVFNDAAGVKLPRDSRSQHRFCTPVKASDAMPGDLVFFSGRAGGSTVGHVGLYIGDNSIIHASTSRGVIISSLDERYYRTHYVGTGRVHAITYAATHGVPPVEPAHPIVSEPAIAAEPPVAPDPVVVTADPIAVTPDPTVTAASVDSTAATAAAIRARVGAAMRRSQGAGAASNDSIHSSYRP